MSRPKLMCIDEPSTGLAPILRKHVFEKIGEIRNLGISLLLVEQEVSTVFKMSSRNYVLSSGRSSPKAPASSCCKTRSSEKPTWVSRRTLSKNQGRCSRRL